MFRPWPRGSATPTAGLASPFNAHQSQYVGSRFFGYNSPATIARELFKPSTDAGRRLGSILKKNF